MRDFREIKKYIPLITVFLVLLVICGVFFSRPPVLIVTDVSFNYLYGAVRVKLKSAISSLELGRRVMPIVISESAGPDLVSLAVEGAHKSPYVVLFPYRYLDGARYYREGHPKIPVMVMSGKYPGPMDEADLSFVRTDLALDYYRAGLCAAILVEDGKSVLFFTDGSLAEGFREAFRMGLRDQGFDGTSVFYDASNDYPSYSDIGCVIVAGPAAKFLEKNLEIPAIYFSWINPAMSPLSAKIIFDDSPLTLAARSLHFLKNPEEEPLLPSFPAVHLLGNEKKDFRILYELVKANLPKK